MEMNRTSSLFLFALAVLVFVTVEANIAVYDKYWQKREEEAKESALQAYEDNPGNVISHLNENVHNSTDGKESKDGTIKRELRNVQKVKGHQKFNGPCMATNPIDACWRCDKNWAQNRKKLADCALGFGRHATGGKAGKFYEVTDPSDNDLINPKPGTLRHAAIQPQPLWITFARSMTIRLNEELIMTSDKTIDGRGAHVHIANGAGLMLQFVKNVIIHGLHIHDIKAGSGGLIRDSVGHFGYRSKSDGDGISVFGSTNVWIDHISMSNCQDGLIDAVQAATAITISNCHFTHHNEALLFGASDSSSEDAIMQITVVFNHFGQGIIQRMPRARWGFVHIVNNDYTHWLMYAIGGSQHPTLLSQGNRFIAPPNAFAKEVTKRDYAPESVWKNWVWKSEGDLMMNGAYFVPSGDPHHKFGSGPDMIRPKPGQYVSKLTRFTGALKCIPGKPC